MKARGGTDAAVLLAIYGWPEQPGADLHRAPG